MPDWYTAPVADVSQGDIFTRVPSVYVPSPVQVGRFVTGRGGVAQVELTDVGQEGFPWSSEQAVVTRGAFPYGVMLTHDCEIDKDDRYRLMAMVRPIEGAPAEAIDEIRIGGRRRFFHLPAESEIYDFPESYIDFRRLTAVRVPVLQLCPRVLSMSEHLRSSMREALITYLTRAVE